MPIKRTAYPHSNDYAREHDELPAYRESNKINRECAAAIDKAISDSNYEPFHYDLKSAMQKVTAEYGQKRVAWVLAAVVQDAADYDVRYSPQNREWARSFPIPVEQRYGNPRPRLPYYGTNAHPTLVDSFINYLRIQMMQKKERKTSVTGALKDGAKQIAAAKPAHEQNKTKKSEQEI